MDSRRRHPARATLVRGQLDVARIAARVQRSEGAIVSRLVKLDFFASSEDARAANRLRRKTPADSTPD